MVHMGAIPVCKYTQLHHPPKPCCCVQITMWKPITWLGFTLLHPTRPARRVGWPVVGSVAAPARPQLFPGIARGEDDAARICDPHAPLPCALGHAQQVMVSRATILYLHHTYTWHYQFNDQWLPRITATSPPPRRCWHTRLWHTVLRPGNLCAGPHPLQTPPPHSEGEDGGPQALERGACEALVVDAAGLCG